MKITQELTLDIARDNSYKIVRAKQYDEDSRFLKITITNRGEIIKIPSGATVILGVKRADAECGDFAGTVNAKDGTVTVPIPNWVLQVAGNNICDVSIIKDGERFSTSNFNVLVENAPTNEPDITEDENYDVLISLIERIENAIDEPDDPESPDVPIVIDENVINKIIDPDNYPLEENTDVVNYDTGIEIGKLSRSSGAERDDEGGLRMDDFVPIEYSYGYVKFVFDTASDGEDRLCLIAYKSDYTIALDASGAGWYQYVSSGYDYNLVEDLSLPEDAAYLRGYLSTEDTSTGGIVSVTFSNGNEGVKRAEHKKIYIADHGYTIYGDEIDNATMHKLVIRALGLDGNSYNITEIKAPSDNPEEATLALMNWGNGYKQFVDFSSMIYHGKPTVEIVCQTRGGEPLPEFSVRYNSGDGNGRVKKFVVHPDAIPIELTASGLKVRRNNNFDNDGVDADFATINLFELATQSIDSIAVLKSPSGKRFQLHVDDNGALTTSEISEE